MIPQDYITEWSASAPWTQNLQVEQDLIISRVLIELFNHPKLAKTLAFRGGTALYKLFIQPPARYSEDIDLVQVQAEPIGETLSAIKNVINPILGTPKWKLGEGRATLYYKFQSESSAQIFAKVKIEINTREHFSVYGFHKKLFSMRSRWFSGETQILTYQFDELIGTKLRALFQRKKSRDLFDLWIALQQASFSPERAVAAFSEYMQYENKVVTRLQFQNNLQDKMNDRYFLEDISVLFAEGVTWNIHDAADKIFTMMLSLIPET